MGLFSDLAAAQAKAQPQPGLAAAGARDALPPPAFVDPRDAYDPNDPNAQQGLMSGMRSAFNSGLTGAKGDLRALAGGLANAVGARDFAAEQYQKSKELQQQAAAEAPQLRSYKQVDGLGSGARYVANTLAGGLPVLAPAVAGAALAPEALAGAAAGTALLAPFTVGHQFAAAQDDPVQRAKSPQEQAVAAVLSGTGSALAQTLIPGHLAGTAVRGAEGVAARTLAQSALHHGAEGVAGNAVGGYAGTAIGQAGETALNPNRDTSHDEEARRESAVGGAVLGAPFAGMGVAGEAAHNAAASAKEGVGQAARAVTGAAGAGAKAVDGLDLPGKIGKVASDAYGALQGADYIRHPELADLTTPQTFPPELEGKSPQEIVSWMDADNAKRNAAAEAVAQRTLSVSDAPPEAKQAAQAFLDAPPGADRWKSYAGTLEQAGKLDRVTAKLGQAGSQLADWLGSVTKKSNLEQTPQDVEYLGAMRDPLAKTLGTGDAPTVDHAAALLNDYVMSGFAADSKGRPRVPDGLVDALGDRAPTIIAAAYDNLRRQGRTRAFDDTAKERLAAVGKLVSDRLGDLNKGADIVQHQLTPTMFRRIPQDTWPDIADGVRQYLRSGEKNDAVEAHLDQLFGANKDVVLEQLSALDPQRPAAKFGREEGNDVTGDSTDARGQGEEDAGSDVATDDHESPLTELADVPDYHFKGSNPNKPEAFDRADPFLAKNVQLAKDRMDTNVVSMKFNHDTGMDEPYTSEVGAAQHARESGDNSMLTKLREAHPELSDKELDKRFFVLGTRNKPTDVESIDINPTELNRPATKNDKPNKASWQDITTVKSKAGNRDVSTIDHGRIYMTPGEPAQVRHIDPATGEELPPGRGGVEVVDKPAVKQGKEFITSAQKLITKMWERKGQGAFDERTAEKTGPEAMLSMFAAGLSSLHATGKFHGEMRVKMPDGTMRAIDKTIDLPDNFVLWDGKNGKVTVGDARKAAGEGIRKLGRVDKETGKYPAPQKESDTVRISDIPHMTRDELRAAGEETKAALDNPKLSDGAREALQTKLDAFREAYDKRVTDAAPGEKKETAGPVGERTVDRQDDGKLRGSRAEHHGIGEGEETAAAKAKEHDNTERRFDELTGIELHPKSDDLPSVRSLDQQAEGMRRQYKALDAKIKELEALPGTNKVRDGRINKLRAELADVVTKGKALSARIEGATKSSLEAKGKANVTPEQKAEVSSYIEKTLGPKVAQEFTDQLRGSGEWSRDPKNQQATIKISTSALNPLSVAHHEAMHEFFQRLVDDGHKQAVDTLTKFASGELVKRQLERTFADQPEVLKQIAEDPSERLAYAFQLWAADKLKVGPQTETIFRKIISVIRKTIGLLSNDQKAEEILNSFHSGEMSEPNAVARVLNTQEARGAWLKKVGAAAKPILSRSSEWVGFAENALTGSKNPALDWVGRQFNNKTGSQGDKQGFLSAKTQENARYMNKFAAALHGVDPAGKDKRTATKADVDLALEGLQKGTWHADPVVRRIQDGVVSVFKEMYEYMAEAGVKRFDPETKEWVPVSKRDDYRTPVSWDPAKIIGDSARFKALLLEHHGPILDGIAEKANAEVAAGNHAGEYTASWNALQNKSDAPLTRENIADAILQRMISTNGQVEQKESDNALGFSPFMKSVNQRTLDWIDQKVFHEFQEKDMTKIISSYVSQATKRAEYSRRFGADGGILEQKMSDAWHHEINSIMSERHGVDDAVAKAQQAVAQINAKAKTKADETTFDAELGKLAKGADGKAIGEEAVKNLEPARRAIMAMEGTLGHDISPLLRKVSSYTTVYQNMRLLGYSMFSNIIDPLGIMVRGGEVKDAYAAFKRGMRDVFREWGDLTGLREAKESDHDEATRIAEMIGTVDSAGFMSQMGTMFGSQYMNPGAKKANDEFFRWNGTEALNRAMRIQATQAAIGFIKRHFEAPNEHSERYFKELDLKRSDVQIDKDGRLNVDNPVIQQAVMRWVDGAVLRPNAAMRPTMASDPHFAVFYHLKQFMYAMQAVILKRAQVEVKNGNTSPLVTLMAGYIPVMIAADAAKGLLQAAVGGGAPVWEHEGVAGIMSHGAQRAGLLGIGQIPVDAVNYGLPGVFGPTAEQVSHAVTEPLTQTLATAAAVGPANMLLRGANWDQ